MMQLPFKRLFITVENGEITRAISATWRDDAPFIIYRATYILWNEGGLTFRIMGEGLRRKVSILPPHKLVDGEIAIFEFVDVDNFRELIKLLLMIEQG